jgi:hypothetical protein
LAATAVLGLAMLAVGAFGSEPTYEPAPVKVKLCHKGKVITISERAVEAHVKSHGDHVVENGDKENGDPCEPNGDNHNDNGENGNGNGNGNGDNHRRVTICHKGKVITISARAVDAHEENHGDYVIEDGNDLHNGDACESVELSRAVS